MRVIFTPPTEAEFTKLLGTLTLKKGGGLDDITIFQPYSTSLRGRQRGGGFFSFISGVAKRVLPFLFKAAKPAVKEFGSSVVQDIIKGDVPIKKSLKKHGIRALKNTGERLIKGSGKIKKKQKTNVSKKLKKTLKKIKTETSKKKKKRKTSTSRDYKRDIFSIV